MTRWLALAALWLSACSGVVPQPSTEPERPARPPEVLLIPVGDFSYPVAVQLARELTRDVDVEVFATLPMGVGDLHPQTGEQYAAEDILARVAQVGARQLYRHSPSIAIGLTTLDINQRDGPLRFLFASGDPATHATVLSLARLGYTTGRVEGTPAQVYTRLYKMTKRAIGEQYLGLPRSSDVNDVMYAPIMSLDDVDEMGSDFARHPVPHGSIELPPAPQGYAWRRVPALAAAVLVPDGWYFREEKSAKSYSLFVTQEQIVGNATFETGATLNAFLDSPAAPLRIGDRIRDLAISHSAHLYVGKHAQMNTVRCEFDSPRQGGLEPLHAFYLGIVNPRTRTSYLLLFEAPASQWTEAWKRGLPILDQLALAADL